MAEIRVAIVRPSPPPSYRYDDVDGDWLYVTAADIPQIGPGVYFRTTTAGASVPVADIPALIEKLREIAAYAEENR